MTKVLYVSQPEAMSGAERSLIELVRHLPDSIEPVVATPSESMRSALTELGVDTEALPAVDFSFRPDPVRIAAGATWVAGVAVRLRRLVTTGRFSLIHANNTKEALPATVAGLGPASPPIVVHIRDEMPRTRAGSSVLRWVGRLSDELLVNSSFIGEQFAGRRPPVRVAYNSVDATRFDPDAADRRRIRDELGLGTAPVIAVIAHFIPPKGQADAVRTLAALKRTVPEARLLLVGSAKFDDPGTRFDSRAYLDRVKRLALDLGLADDVVFAGERADVPDVLAATDVLLVPSEREPFGRVVIEAMAMRVPIVSTNVAGPAEIVTDDGDGLLSASRDPAEWAALIERILGSPRLAERLGEQGRRTALERFGAERSVAAVLEAYASALGSPRS